MHLYSKEELKKRIEKAKESFDKESNRLNRIRDKNFVKNIPASNGSNNHG